MGQHGSAYYAEVLEKLIGKEAPDKTILLGDLLYHGPRNDLPRDYDTKRVTAILNGLKNKVLAVRGNCDSEVDQMVLEFPIMADYMALFLEGRMVFVTHGHLFNEENLPNFGKGDVLIHGHTHLRVAADRGDYFFLNPGSMSLRKVKRKGWQCLPNLMTLSMKGSIPVFDHGMISFPTY